MDLQTSSSDAKGIQYTSGGESYTQACGSRFRPAHLYLQLRAGCGLLLRERLFLRGPHQQ